MRNDKSNSRGSSAPLAFSVSVAALFVRLVSFGASTKALFVSEYGDRGRSESTSAANEIVMFCVAPSESKFPPDLIDAAAVAVSSLHCEPKCGIMVRPLFGHGRKEDPGVHAYRFFQGRLQRR